MFRYSIFAAALFAFVPAIACNNASSDEKKAQAAQAEANDKSGAAMNEADEKAKSAQAESRIHSSCRGKSCPPPASSSPRAIAAKPIAARAQAQITTNQGIRRT